MQGKWRITRNVINGKEMFAVFRLKDDAALDHSGNREYATEYMENLETAKEKAKALNLECVKEMFDQGHDPTALMNEMELIFGIPAMYSQSFTEANPGVMGLYRRISDSRF